jgi:pseudouridine-5'-phosphate glycosidase
MLPALPANFQLAPEVVRALELKMPIVALESTVITHGLPYPENLNLAEDMEAEVRSHGVTPATVAVIEGRITVGLHSAQLQTLAIGGEKLMKISLRDFAPAVAKMVSGGTTVAGTMYAAHRAGIKVFATGGIGGVHHELNPKRKGTFDISTDLPALATIPMIVVCAGAKAILDLPATLEYLETWGVPVVGYQTDDFPAFYTRKSGYKTSTKAASAEEVSFIARAHWGLGMKSGVLVVVPPPDEVALPAEDVQKAVVEALKAAREQKISGQKVTPFLLSRVNELTGGASMRANLGLLLNNALVASQIARYMALPERSVSA